MSNKRKRKSNSQQESKENVQKRQTLEKPLPDGVHFYQDISEVPWDVQKYWQQGYDMFSLYDQGIWMTDNSWFEVTHESIAHKIAEHMDHAAPEERAVVLDPFCGVGGNVIALAQSKRWKRVYAIEKDPAALACARHNAEIYGVADRITFFEGDCFEQLKKPDAALVHLIKNHGVIIASPPWGGPSYKSTKTFDLETMEPYSLSVLHVFFTRLCPYVGLYLPRTSDLQQIARLAEEQTQVVHYCTNGLSRALCVYFGDWGKIQDSKDQ